jgi:hypothetical protein
VIAFAWTVPIRPAPRRPTFSMFIPFDILTRVPDGRAERDR